MPPQLKLPADRFPHTRRYAAELTSGTGHDRFDFTLTLIIDNLTPHHHTTPLPAPAQEWRARAYFRRHIWAAAIYHGAGRADNATTHLQAAAQYYPLGLADGRVGTTLAEPRRRLAARRPRPCDRPACPANGRPAAGLSQPGHTVGQPSLGHDARRGPAARASGRSSRWVDALRLP